MLATDPDPNLDPTAIDSTTVRLDIEVLHKDGTSSSGTYAGSFEETDVNTGEHGFDIALGTGPGTLVGDMMWWVNPITAFVDGDLVDIEFNDPIGVDKKTVTIEIKLPPPEIPEFSFSIPMVTSIAVAVYVFMRKRLERRGR